MGYELTDRVVFLTGASKGIGRATAVEFHRAGARVVAVARSADQLDALADKLGSERILAIPADVTDPSQRTAALDRARTHFGPIDVLVNNAAWASFTSVQRMPPEHYERMVALNLSTPIALIQAVLPAMLERGSGQIINVASVVAYQALPRMAVYSATKAALVSLSTALRMELHGTGVDVLVVSPGTTKTNFFESAAKVDATARRGGRPDTAEKVARVIVSCARRRRREVVLTPEGKAIALVRRCWPRLADGLISLVARHSMPLVPVAEARSAESAGVDKPSGCGD
jgi:short-subunit dehydrogenase